MMTPTDTVPCNDLFDFQPDPKVSSTKLPANSMFGLPSDEDSACADIDRWATSSSVGDSSSQINGSEKIKDLEEEHKRLNESVLSLSTQFAHIQFRLQQINSAPSENRDEMLKELVEFASQSCFDISSLREETHQIREQLQSGMQTAEIGEKKARVVELIQKLRSQTEDLEKFAYENGHGEMPLCQLKQRQKVVFDKLQEKIQLKIDLDKLSTAEFQQNLEQGIEEVLNPIKEKDQLVDQLQTQITDLERFVSFLQQESVASENDEEKPDRLVRSIESAYKRQLPVRQKSIFGLIGCQSKRHFERNELKKTVLGNHYGDQRAQLELAVDKVLQVMKHRQLLTIDRPEREDMTPEEINDQIFQMSDEAIVAVVRKHLSPCLGALLQHGLKSTVETGMPFAASSFSYLGIGCFSNRNAHLKRQVSIGDGRAIAHVWDVIALYFEVKKAEERQDAAVGSLTQAFKLDSIDGKQATSYQILLATIENIINSHDRLKRSMDAKWKAFISAALNQKRLTGWLRMIFRSDFILYKCYNTWSYVCRTGCEDIRPLFEKLNEFTFELPIDLAIRPFNGKEAY
ncbi:RUN domain-containing protein [Aphelenchoides bicaudatus]|nr:RUN domain-containing protein [Aphelenchoides bicaudatus]